MQEETLKDETRDSFFSKEKPVFWLFFTLYFLLGLVFVFLGNVWWGDEDFYFGGSWLVANGGLPYRDFFIHHNPVFLYIYAIPQYFFGPSIIVGRLTSLLVMMLSFVLVWRLARKLGGRTAALITAGLLITNLFIAYYFTTFSYRVLEAFLMLLFFTVLFGDLKDSIKYPLTTFLLCLVVGIRYPVDIMSGLLVLYLIYTAYRNWGNKGVILLSFSVAVLSLGAITLPFILLARDQFLFDTVVFPFLMPSFWTEFGIIAGQADILDRLYHALFVLFQVFQNFYAVVAVLFGLLLYFVLRYKAKTVDIKDLSTKNQSLIFLLIFIILFEIFCAIAPHSSVGLRSLTFSAAAIVAGVGLARVLADIRDKSATLLLYSLIIGLVLLTPCAQFAQGEARPALTWKNADINYVYKVADKVASYTDEGDKILTFTPMFVHLADRELLPGTVMELFAFFPTWETEKCKKYNLLNASMLLDYISSQEAGAVVLTEARFFSGQWMGKVLDKYRPEILKVLDENYYLAEKLSYPNIGRGDVYIYLPRQP